MEKKKLYDQLASDVRADYLNNDHELKWCEDCKEINLWTYWQGRNHMDAQIMLVGQDWGCPWDKPAMAVMENVKAMNGGKAAHYMMEETYHNGLVIADYRDKMSELGLDERNVMRAEKEWVEQLPIEGADACLAYHFRRDRFCEGSLIYDGIADGCVLRLMERLYKLLSAVS